VRGVLAAWLFLPACLLKPDPPSAPKAFDTITLGSHHACSLAGFTVYCWGSNRHGQLDMMTNGEPVLRPTDVGGSWRAISAGSQHTCGVRDDGALLCWGADDVGQSSAAAGGGDVPAPHAVPLADGATATFKRVEAGALHSCALTEQDELWCWGHQDQIMKASSTAVSIMPGMAWRDIALGTDHTCGIVGNDVYCWGSNDKDQCGPGGSVVLTPMKITFPSTVPADLVPKRVFAGEQMSCALMTEPAAAAGKLVCWGANTGRRIMDAGDAPLDPTPLPGDAWTDAAISTQIMCGVENGTATCWGTSSEGGGGGGQWRSIDSPATRESIGAADAIDLAFSAHDSEPTTEFGCMRRGGDILCWGDAPFGEVGRGIRTAAPTAVTVKKLDSDEKWLGVWTGTSHTCARNAKHFYCWGANESGQIDGVSRRGLAPPCIDDPNAVCDRPEPYALPDLEGKTVADAVAGESFTCARTTEGELWCWGDAGDGATGPGAQEPAPNRLPGVWTALFGGPRAVCGVTGGALTCWGRIDENTTNGRTFAIANPVNGYLTGSSECVLDAGGGRWCWGDNTYGQFGAGSVGGNSNVPSMLPDATGVSRIALANNHACQIKDGELRCWGQDTRGASGHSGDTGTPSLVFDHNMVQLSSCREVSAGDLFTCAACGTQVFCWGDNTAQQLGRGATDVTSSVDADFVHGLDADAGFQLAAGLDHACVIDSGGGLHCWGHGDRGQLGDGAHATNLPAPVLSP
jgi:alpha-tubulin suppressor-like RCC1 family protein